MPSDITRSTICSTASGSTGWSQWAPPSERIASAIAAWVHFAAEPWAPWASARPALTWARNCCGVEQAGTSVKVAPMSTPA